MKKVTTCEICKGREPLEMHHIQSKKYNGPNAMWNIAFLCSECHYKVHSDNNERVVIEGKFMNQSSKVLIYRKVGEESITGLPDPKVVIVKRNKDKE